LIGISPNPGLRRSVIPGIVGSSLEIYGEREQANHNGDHKNVFSDGFSGTSIILVHDITVPRIRSTLEFLV
jgi:hypothetical protein